MTNRPTGTQAGSRSAIVARWLDEIAKTYPAGASPFAGDIDAFRNPVAHVLVENAAILVDAAVLGKDWDRAASALGEIVRVRAVQGFRAEEAGAFIESLKPIARGAGQSTSDVDVRLDRLMKLAVELHGACRQRIDEIAAREARRRTWLLEQHQPGRTS